MSEIQYQMGGQSRHLCLVIDDAAILQLPVLDPGSDVGPKDRTATNVPLVTASLPYWESP